VLAADGSSAQGEDRLRDLAAALRADLAAAEYIVDAVTDLLGPLASAALHRDQLVPAGQRLDRAPESPLGTLVRLFLLALPVTRRSLDVALPRTGTDVLVALGLVAAGPGAQVTALLDLRPHAAAGQDSPSWWVVSDLDETATGAPLPEHHVLGIGSASLTLAGATVRRPAARALDLGTGSGVQVLHATAHATHVVATDVSARALRVAALTVQINGLGTRVELRQGDLLEPVAGERFDLIVSNPPFVITPRRADVPALQYRDGGLAGDEVVRRLVTGLGAHLEPGRIAQLLGNWEIPAGWSWDERVGQWVQESGLDAWVVQREVLDPAEYAELWIRDGGVTVGEPYERLYAA